MPVTRIRRVAHRATATVHLPTGGTGGGLGGNGSGAGTGFGGVGAGGGLGFGEGSCGMLRKRRTLNVQRSTFNSNIAWVTAATCRKLGIRARSLRQNPNPFDTKKRAFSETRPALAAILDDWGRRRDSVQLRDSEKTIFAYKLKPSD